MTVGANPGFWRVARREVQWLVHDRVALVLIFGGLYIGLHYFQTVE